MKVRWGGFGTGRYFFLVALRGPSGETLGMEEVEEVGVWDESINTENGIAGPGGGEKDTARCICFCCCFSCIY